MSQKCDHTTYQNTYTFNSCASFLLNNSALNSSTFHVFTLFIRIIISAEYQGVLKNPMNSLKSIKHAISTEDHNHYESTRVGTLIVATSYLQLIQNRYMFRSFTVLQCSHQHCVQPVASDVEVVGYL